MTENRQLRCANCKKEEMVSLDAVQGTLLRCRCGGILVAVKQKEEK